MIFIDECHATGFFGKTGRGTEEFFGMKVGSSTQSSTIALDNTYSTQSVQPFFT